jgi:hypothetical protein
VVAARGDGARASGRNALALSGPMRPSNHPILVHPILD